MPREVPMNSRVKRRVFLAAVSLLGVFATKVATASQKKTYKYRCPKCKLIQEYGSMGSKKCPNDGTTMVRMN
jgi:hypothetical protein